MSDIKNALDSLSKKVGPSDNFLIFFAGKGYWDDASQTGFWLPSDAKEIGYWLILLMKKRATGLPGSVTECLEIGSVRSIQNTLFLLQMPVSEVPYSMPAVFPEMQWLLLINLMR